MLIYMIRETPKNRLRPTILAECGARMFEFATGQRTATDRAKPLIGGYVEGMEPHTEVAMGAKRGSQNSGIATKRRRDTARLAILQLPPRNSNT